MIKKTQIFRLIKYHIWISQVSVFGDETRDFPLGYTVWHRQDKFQKWPELK